MKRILTAFQFGRARHFIKGEECGITFTMEWNFQAIKQKLDHYIFQRQQNTVVMYLEIEIRVPLG